jgi:hypothetical protein
VPAIIVVLGCRPFYRCGMAEEPETNRPSNTVRRAARSAPPSLLEGLARRIDADTLLGSILASEYENPVPEETIGTLAAVDDEKITVETRLRFKIPVAGAPALLRSAIGKKVGVLVIDGRVRWRLVEPAREPGRGEQP